MHFATMPDTTPTATPAAMHFATPDTTPAARHAFGDSLLQTLTAASTDKELLAAAKLIRDNHPLLVAPTAKQTTLYYPLPLKDLFNQRILESVLAGIDGDKPAISTKGISATGSFQAKIFDKVKEMVRDHAPKSDSKEESAKWTTSKPACEHSGKTCPGRSGRLSRTTSKQKRRTDTPSNTTSPSPKL
jgi:hypothetical protein